MEHHYKYIGAICHPIPSDNFATSLFSTEGNYFIQENRNGYISTFKEIAPPDLITKVIKEVYVKAGDEYFYSYITHKNELFYGNKEDIEPLLIKLTKRNDINVHAKLLISSFLRFYDKTYQYLNEANKDLQKNGVKSKIDENIISKKLEAPSEIKPNFFNLINDRYEKLHKIDNTIKLEDIAIINDDKGYFQNFFFKFSDFLNEENLSNNKYKITLTGLIKKSYLQGKINLEKLINLNDSTFEFLLNSDEILFEQKELENFISTQAVNIDKSIIDIGLEVDKEISENGKLFKYNNFSIDKEGEKKIRESFSLITAVD